MMDRRAQASVVWTCVALIALAGCGGGDKKEPSLFDDHDGGEARDAGRDGASGVGGSGGAGIGGASGDGGTDPLSGPLSLEITDVITSQYEDCIEPLFVNEPPAATTKPASEKRYFVAETDSATTPPEGWSVGTGCVAGDSGLQCASSGTLLSHSAEVTRLITIQLDVEADVAGTLVAQPSGTSVTVEAGADSKRVTMSVWGQGMNLYWNTNGTIRLSNLTVDMTLDGPDAVAIKDNENVIFDIYGDETTGIPDWPYVASFSIDQARQLGVGWLCNEKASQSDSCGMHVTPTCRIIEPNLTFSSLGWEWDPAVDPNETQFENSQSIQRAQNAYALEPGTYAIACNMPASVFVRSYDASLARSCNFLTWYFSLRQGGEAVTGLSVDDITPTVDLKNLGVEAGAQLSQNNNSRVALLLDRSFSITEAGATDAVISAAKTFVDAMPADTWFQIHQFASEDDVPLNILSPPSNEPEEVKTRLDDYSPWAVSNSQGFTKLFDAIGGTSVQGYATPPQEPPNFDFLQKIMVVFTDGDDTASTLYVDAQGTPNADTVVNQLRVCRVKGLSVGMGSDIQESTLRSLTGDSFFLAADTDELQDTFEAVAEDLNSRYRFKMVTPQPVTITESSALRIDFNGESTEASYRPPERSCGMVVEEPPVEQGADDCGGACADSQVCEDGVCCNAEGICCAPEYAYECL